MKAHADRTAIASLVASSLLAGGNGVSVRLSNRELDPLWGAALRFSIAALLLIAVMAALRLRPPRGRALGGAVLFGTLNFGVAYALTYFALVRLHGGFGQVLVSVVPLVTLLLAAAWGQERLTLTAVASTVPALIGVVVLSWGVLGGPIPVIYLLAMTGSALCLSQAAVVVRAFPPVHPVTMNAVGMTVGGGVLLAGSALCGDDWTLPQLTETRLALGYLVVFGSIGSFLLYLVALQYWKASRASYQAVLIPFVAVVLSARLDDEPIGVGLLGGGALILVSVYLGVLRPSRVELPVRPPAARR